MTKLRIALTSSDTQACGMLRVRWPAQALAQRGDIEIVEYNEIKIDCDHPDEKGIIPVRGVVDPPDADVLVLQRTAEQVFADAIPYYQKLGIAVVIDLDDDLQHLSSIHPQHRFYNTNLTGWRHLKRACMSADMVIASTPGIAKNYASHGRVKVIRNCMPQHYLYIDAERNGKTVGWGGTILNHPGDLDVTHGGVAAAVLEAQADFHVVGLKEGVAKALGLDERTQLTDTGIVEFLDYAELVSHFDVGIAPLADNRYNTSKSGLKILEYMALGIPWVASPRPEYLRIHDRSKTGYIAKDRARDWRRSLLTLLKDPELRKEEAFKSRAYVEENCLIQDECWRWLEVWEMAAHRRQGIAA
jgi:glycosyltransferase involved in cell wall biosynthesis